MKRLAFSVFFLVFANLLFAQKEITLQDIWTDYKFIPKSVPGFASMPNSDFYTVKDKTAISKHSFENGDKVADILTKDMLDKSSGGKLSLAKLKDYEFDASCSKILLAFNLDYIYRRSTCAN